MTRYGSDLIVDLIKRYQIPHISLNPGSTYRGLHDSLVNYGGNDPPMILCPHEEIAVFVALGYAKTTGKPMVAIVHDTVGLLHCTMAVYYAYLDRVPLILLGAAGPMETTRRRPHIDWIHTTVHQAQPIRDFIKWDRQPVNAQEVVESFARGYRVAMQEPRGPVYLCYDAAFQEDPLTTDVALPDPDKYDSGTLAHPDPHAMDELAGLLTKAKMPVIIAGYAGRNPSAFHDLVALAEMSGAAVIDLNQRLNFPTTHRLNVSYTQYELLTQADLVLAVDVKDLYGPLVKTDRVKRRTEYLIPKSCKIVEIGYRDVNISKWSDEYQQLVPVDLDIIADSSVALPQLVARVKECVAHDVAAPARIRARSEAISKVYAAARQKWQADAKNDWDASPMTTGRLASEIWAVIKNEDWVLAGNTLEEWALKLWDFDAPLRHPGKSLGTSTQIGVALGVALAHKGSGRIVVDIQPDGDLMFDPGALWVAANQRIPMLVVMYNNRAYYNDWEHQIRLAEARGTSVERARIGQAIDEPAPDFANLARSFGWYAEGPIVDPTEANGALTRALGKVKAGQPALVDTVTRFR